MNSKIIEQLACAKSEYSAKGIKVNYELNPHLKVCTVLLWSLFYLD